jgi:hypothetical protein
MPITPARPAAHPAPVAESKAATNGEPGDPSGSPLHLRQRAGWQPHHAPPALHASHWIASMHRAMPQVALGMRAGVLVPPRGAVLHHSANGSPASKPASAGNAARAARVGAGGRSDSDGDAAGTADADAARALLSGGPRATVGSGQFGGSGSGAGGGGDGSAAAMWARESLGRPAAARAGGGVAQVVAPDHGAAVESPAQVSARLHAGELCWVASFRLAMACAQHHPGTDIFVQAFSIVDADGCVIPAFGRKARMRADAQGRIVVQPDPTTVADASVTDTRLLDELHSSALLSLSLRPVLDESGQPASALSGAAPAELSALRRLFERPMEHRQREALCAAAREEVERWQQVCRIGAQPLADQGDALERELNEQRSRLSVTIDSGDLNAHRAKANWLRAQAQVQQWAARDEWPQWHTLCFINKMLGEGLKPWNRAEQSDRVGARFGELRHFDVVSGTPPQYFLRADQLRDAVAELFEWLEQQRRFDTPVAIVAAQMHQRLVSLHPFADANGRSARLVVDWLLALAGLPPPLLQPASLALFANEVTARQAPPGLAEQGLLDGIAASVDLHLQWAGVDA